MNKTTSEAVKSLAEIEEQLGVKLKRVWYFDIGEHTYRFIIGKVYGNWGLNIGLGFCDFGYGYDKA